MKLNYIYQLNSERSAARNNGGEKANGAYLIFLDSDDFFEKNHLSYLFNFISNNRHTNALIISNFEP